MKLQDNLYIVIGTADVHLSYLCGIYAYISIANLVTQGGGGACHTLLLQALAPYRNLDCVSVLTRRDAQDPS